MVTLEEVFLRIANGWLETDGQDAAAAIEAAELDSDSSDRNRDCLVQCQTMGILILNNSALSQKAQDKASSQTLLERLNCPCHLNL
eukprot:3929824-Amphidinium_carterae.1